MDRCTRPYFKLIEPAHITGSNIEYRSKQIAYYNSLIDEECNKLNRDPAVTTTCFVQNWNEQNFMKLGTQDCGTNRNAIMVAVFSIYTLIPFILVNQNSQRDSCEEYECKWADRRTPVCPEGCYCAGENCATPFQEKVIYEQERLFHEFTLCPTWAFPTSFFLNFIDRKEYTEEEKKIPDIFGGIDSIYGPIIASLHTIWRNALNKNPDTIHLFGLCRFPGHVISYCLGKNGLCEIFDSNGSANLLQQPDRDDVIEVLKNALREQEELIKECKLLNLKCDSLVAPIIHQILSLAMATFRDTPNTFFVRGGRLSQRWPVVINKSPLHHGGSCGMWSVLYLFLRTLMAQFDSIRLQNVFTKLTDENNFKCLYIAPFEDLFVPVGENSCDLVDKKIEVFCSRDIGRVFWFSLSKAFQYCVGTKPAVPRFFFSVCGRCGHESGSSVCGQFLCYPRFVARGRENLPWLR